MTNELPTVPSGAQDPLVPSFPETTVIEPPTQRRSSCRPVDRLHRSTTRALLPRSSRRPTNARRALELVRTRPSRSRTILVPAEVCCATSSARPSSGAVADVPSTITTTRDPGRADPNDQRIASCTLGEAVWSKDVRQSCGRRGEASPAHRRHERWLNTRLEEWSAAHVGAETSSIGCIDRCDRASDRLSAISRSVWEKSRMSMSVVVAPGTTSTR